MKLLVLDTIIGGQGISYSLIQIALVLMDLNEDKLPAAMPKIDFIVNNTKKLDIDGPSYRIFSKNGLLEKSMNSETSFDLENISSKINYFILKNYNFNIGEKIIIAGEQPYNDLKFIKKYLPDCNINYHLHNNILDPTVLFLNPEIDRYVPNLKQCLEKIGADKTMKYDALDNCYKIIKLIKNRYEIK